ncbi:hypothetical protein BKA70DRAFT_1113350, partial [Coprinopsis sp. MPI-PUGE-AT-0042]
MSLRARALTRRNTIIASAYVINVAAVAMQIYSMPLYWKQPFHNSKLTGAEWVEELIHGHPERIRLALGVSMHVFLTFVHELRVICGLMDSRHGVTVNEQAAIFLY